MDNNKLQKIIVYTDGGARGNPGPAAIGVVLKNENSEVLKTYSERIGVVTNNVAEYKAVIFALKKIKQLFGGKGTKKMAVEVRMDSELVAKQLGGEYKIEEEHLKSLFVDLWNLKFDFGVLNFRSILREHNKEADRLVNEALDRGQESLL